MPPGRKKPLHVGDKCGAGGYWTADRPLHRLAIRSEMRTQASWRICEKVGSYILSACISMPSPWVRMAMHAPPSTEQKCRCIRPCVGPRSFRAHPIWHERLRDGSDEACHTSVATRGARISRQNRSKSLLRSLRSNGRSMHPHNFSSSIALRTAPMTRVWRESGTKPRMWFISRSSYVSSGDCKS